MRSDKRIASLGQLCIGACLDRLLGITCVGVSLRLGCCRFGSSVGVSSSVLIWTIFPCMGSQFRIGSGFTLMVAEPCSAFHNTIITAFIWLSLIKIQRVELSIKALRHLGDWPYRCCCAEHGTTYRNYGSLRQPILVLAHGSWFMGREGCDADRGARSVLLGSPPWRGARRRTRSNHQAEASFVSARSVAACVIAMRTTTQPPVNRPSR